MRKINEKDFKEAAETLGVEVAIIKAVCEVEAPMGGFLRTGEPVILFERHKFHQFTDGIFVVGSAVITSCKTLPIFTAKFIA